MLRWINHNQIVLIKSFKGQKKTSNALAIIFTCTVALNFSACVHEVRPSTNPGLLNIQEGTLEYYTPSRKLAGPRSMMIHFQLDHASRKVHVQILPKEFPIASGYLAQSIESIRQELSLIIFATKQDKNQEAANCYFPIRFRYLIPGSKEEEVLGCRYNDGWPKKVSELLNRWWIDLNNQQSSQNTAAITEK